MARYKAYDLKQTKMIVWSYAVEEPLDLKPFEQRYANDETGRDAQRTTRSCC
jgi:hypothetical protein